MKKILKRIILLGVIFLFGLKGVKAESVFVSQQFIDNVWSFHYRNGSVWTFGNLPYNYANGKLVYCIQPDARIVTNNYYVYDRFTMSGYSEEDKRKMELYAYYGYGYPGHDSLKYYMATQELIWLLSNDESIKWTTGNTDDTPMIDVSYEKNQILNLIKNHNVLPLFKANEIKGDNYNIDVNKELVLNDENKVVNNYSYEHDNNIEVKVNNNDLIIIPKTIGTHTIKIKPKRINNQSTLIYDDFSIRTQTLASFGSPNLVSKNITIKSDKVPINIYKKDNETDELITKEGIKIKIKNLDTNEYETDELEFVNGKITINIGVGKYKIEEVKTVNPYILNEEGLEFEIKEGSKESNINFKNDTQKGRIILRKKDEDNNYLQGVKFNILDSSKNIVEELETTNEDTYSKYLDLGTYYVKEISTLYGYKLDEKEYKVNLEYDNETKEVSNILEIINEKIKCKIVLFSVSGEDKVDITFGVYKDNKLVYEGKTNQGTSEFYLPYGEYVVKEIGIADGYKLNKKEINLEVSDKVCGTSVSYDHEKVKMPITTSGNNIVFILFMIINLGGAIALKVRY